MKIGYIPDSFGHIAQMPQILRLAGLDVATVWRGVPSAVDRTVFRWVAPDGSAMRTAYLVTSYSNGASLPPSVEELLPRARRILADLAPFTPGGVILAMNGTDHRPPEAHLPELFAKANVMQDEFEFRIGSMEEYLAAAPTEDLPVWHGEMKSGARANLLPGVASARVPLKQAEFRASSLLERYAEPLLAFTWGDHGRLLERAWRWMVENSAHDSVCGCGIDAVADQVLARYVQAARIADLVATDGLATLAGSVDTSSLPAQSEGALIWNPSPRARAGVAEVSFAAPAGAFAMRAPDGSLHPAQVLDTQEQVVVDMTLRGTELARITPTIHSRQIGEWHINSVTMERGRTTTVRLQLGAVPDVPLDVAAAKQMVEDAIARAPRAKFRVLGMGPPLVRALVGTPAIGALGWTTLQPVHGQVPGTLRADGNIIENEYLRAEVDAAGNVTLIERASGARFPGLLAIEDGGDGGDEYNYSPPERDHVVTHPDDVVVEVGADGPVEASLRITRHYRIPTALSADEKRRARRTTVLPVVTEIALRAGEKFLRATIDVHNDASDHRVRTVFPLGFTADHSDADTAFHVTARSLEAEGGVHETAIATYPCRRWVDASDGARGLSIFHRGTPEYEVTGGSAIAMTLLRSVAWLSRQKMVMRAGPAGPKLATPGAQLHGAHRFELAVYPHQGNWRAGEVHENAEAFAYPFRTAVARPHSGPLPPAGEMIRIEPASVQLSAIHKEREAVFVRFYNASDEDVTARVTLPSVYDRLKAMLVNLLNEEIASLAIANRTVEAPLRAWEIATIRLS